MEILLIFFALPLATIILSIALQKILKCPFLVSAIIFAIFLIVTFIVNNLIVLVLAIIYAIISFITAVIVSIMYNLLNKNNSCESRRNDSDCNNNSNNQVSARINVIPNANTNGRTGCICGRYRRR